MSRADVEAKMAKESGITHKQAETAYDSFVNYIVDSLKAGEKVTVVGFGTFSAVQTKARMGRNPKTNQPVPIPAQKKAKFSASSRLKEILNVSEPAAPVAPPAS